MEMGEELGNLIWKWVRSWEPYMEMDEQWGNLIWKWVRSCGTLYGHG